MPASSASGSYQKVSQDSVGPEQRQLLTRALLTRLGREFGGADRPRAVRLRSFGSKDLVHRRCRSKSKQKRQSSGLVWDTGRVAAVRYEQLADRRGSS
jgi:hypothetical protein